VLLRSRAVLGVVDSTLFFLHPVFLCLNNQQHLSVHKLLLVFILPVQLGHHLFERLETSMLAHILLVHAWFALFLKSDHLFDCLQLQRRQTVRIDFVTIRHRPPEVHKVFNLLLLLRLADLILCP